MGAIKKYLTLGLSVSFASAAFIATPAQAGDFTLPDGTNGTDSSDVVMIACPETVTVWAPGRQSETPISELDAAAVDWAFQWKMTNDAGEWTEQVPSMGRLRQPMFATWATPKTPGSTATVSLYASTYDESYNVLVSDAIEVSATVIDPAGYSGGAGTPDDPYLISTPQDLFNIRCEPNASFELANDIDMTGFDWFPIGGSTNSQPVSEYPSFYGSLDGANYSISNLSFENRLIAYAGLFSVFRSGAEIKNLTLENFDIIGGGFVGALTGSGNTGAVIENVRVENSAVTSYAGRKAGLLAGSLSRNVFVNDAYAQGDVTAYLTPMTESSFQRYEVNGIGGLVGWSDGEGDLYLNAEVDANLWIVPHPDFDVADYAAYPESFITKVGGLFGENDDGVTTLDAQVNTTIHIEAPIGYVEEVGGVAGNYESDVSRTRVAATLEIVDMGAESIAKIGGIGGYADDQLGSSMHVDTSVSIVPADGTNNSLNYALTGGGAEVTKVGLVIGEFDDYPAPAYISARGSINVVARVIGDVGGLAGRFYHWHRSNLQEISVSGQIITEASESVTNIAGLVGNVDDDNHTLSQVYTAVGITNSGTAPLTETGVVYSGDDESSNMDWVKSYWNSDFYDSDSGTRYGLAVTTADVDTEAEIELLGFDVFNHWTVDEYGPVLRYPFGVDQSGIGEPIIVIVNPDYPVPTVSAYPNGRTFTTAGGTMIVTGQNLDLARASVNGQDLFVSGDENELSIQIPAGMTPGNYSLMLSSYGNTNTIQGALIITGPGGEAGTFSEWTKRISNTEAKFYAKFPAQQGKVQFVLNGREIGWINAADATDPKLRVANGANYFVRTVTLRPGKNVLEILVAGVKTRRVVYTNR